MAYSCGGSVSLVSFRWLGYRGCAPPSPRFGATTSQYPVRVAVPPTQAMCTDMQLCWACSQSGPGMVVAQGRAHPVDRGRRLCDMRCAMWLDGHVNCPVRLRSGAHIVLPGSRVSGVPADPAGQSRSWLDDVGQWRDASTVHGPDSWAGSATLPVITATVGTRFSHTDSGRALGRCRWW